MKSLRHVVISETPLERAWLDTIPYYRSTYLVASLVACPGWVPVGGVVHTPVDNLTLSVADGEALIARVYQSNVSTADARLVEQVVRMLLWVVYALQEAKLSVKRLRALLLGAGGPPPSAPAASSPPDAPLVKGAITGEALAALPDGDAAGEDARPGPSGTEPSPKPQGGHRSGTGRLRAAAYTGAEHTECRHEELAVGQRCPVCGQGTLYALPPGVAMRIDGQALLSAIRYQLEKLRCSACGQICTARLPAGVGEEKDSPKARAVLAVGRYLLGLPCYRLEAYQAMLGVPVPDATQWDQIEQGGDCAYKVFEDMERQAAQGALLFHNDTAVRIVALIKEHSAILAAAQAHDVSTPKERTGMHTTALVVKVGEHTAILYDSSRRHAGENLQGLLDKREAGLATPLVMSDALSSNEGGNAEAVIRCPCLAHGRRKFSDVADVFPHECQVVLEVIRQVCDHDEQARKTSLSPEARLAYPQAQSQPLMDGLKRWLATQIDEHLVEPNSALGKAIGSLQRHWVTLTRFLSVPGAPLDNNLAERALKLFIRQRNNSLLYQSTHSASSASVLTSLIATCIYAGGNAVEYRVALQAHRGEVCADPAAWLPWAYASSRASP